MSNSCAPGQPFSLAVSLALALAAGLPPQGVAAAETAPYPSKYIRFVLPYAPGGATSVSARILSLKLTEAWGQQVIVDNRPGANTTIGAEIVARSPADGYTIMLVASTLIIAPLLQPVRYDPIKDFTPIAPVNKIETVIAAFPGLPVHNLKELIALAKSKPGQLNYAISSVGTPPHLSAELFSSMVGIKMQGIAYKGGSPAMNDVIGGQVDLFFSNPINVSPQVKSGRLRGIAISGATRASSMPNVPTFAESGVPNFNGAFWQGVLAPAGLPRPLTDKLSTEINKILAMPQVKDLIANQGAVPYIATPEEFAAVIKADMANYARIIKEANIKVDN